MKIVAIIIIIISLIIAVKIVNSVYDLMMRALGADFMFFSTKIKVLWYFIGTMALAGIIGKIFGIV